MSSLVVALLVGSVLPSDFPSPKQAEADLAAGKPKIIVSSGVAGRSPLSPQVDPELGLPIEDTGCIPVADADYNAIVRAWAKTHGLPANSLKARFVTAAQADKALERGKNVPLDGKATLPDGMTVSLHPDSTLRFVAKGAEAPTMQLWGVKGPVSVAVAGTSAFVRGKQGDDAYVLHVDLDKKLLLQRF